MSIQERIALHRQWWARTNQAPLVHVFGPSPAPKAHTGERKKSGSFDVETSPEAFVERKCAPARGRMPAFSDNLPVVHVNFGTAFLPALAGAGFEYDGNTVWSHPCAESAEDLHVRPFSPSNPLWQKYLTLFRAMLEDWQAHGGYLPGPCNIVGPMDCIAAMLGPQNLSMELLVHPEAVKRAAQDAAQLFMDVLTIETDMLRQAGLKDGIVDWMHTWLPGRGRCYSEDFSALCGEALFREFFIEPNAWIARQIDTPYLHIHSGAHLCMPAILDIPNLKAVELSNDPNGPDLDRYIATAHMIQEAGLSLQVSNWEHPLSWDEITGMLSALDPRGMKITFQAQTQDEVPELYEYAKSFRAKS